MPFNSYFSCKVHNTAIFDPSGDTRGSARQEKASYEPKLKHYFFDFLRLNMYSIVLVLLGGTRKNPVFLCPVALEPF